MGTEPIFVASLIAGMVTAAIIVLLAFVRHLRGYALAVLGMGVAAAATLALITLPSMQDRMNTLLWFNAFLFPAFVVAAVLVGTFAFIRYATLRVKRNAA